MCVLRRRASQRRARLLEEEAMTLDEIRAEALLARAIESDKVEVASARGTWAERDAEGRAQAVDVKA